MRRTRMLALGASLLVLLSACTTGGGSPTPGATTTPATPTATPATGPPPTSRLGSPGPARYPARGAQRARRPRRRCRQAPGVPRPAVDHEARFHAGTGPERIRRPTGNGRPVRPAYDERPRRRLEGPRPRRAARMRDEPRGS